MAALRWLLLVLFAGGFLLFAVANDQTADLRLPNGDWARLPVWLMVLLAFLLGLIPAQLWHGAQAAMWRRREARLAAQLPAAMPAPPPAAPVISPQPAAPAIEPLPVLDVPPKAP